MMLDFLGAATEPVGAFWLALVALLVWRLLKRQWRLAFWPATAALGIYLVCATPLPAYLLASLERPYIGSKLEKVQPADAVVVLGGIAGASAHDAFGFQARPSINRMITGYELVKLGKANAMVLGGAGPAKGTQGFAENVYLERWLSGWGLTNAPIYRLRPCGNTHDEAVCTHELAATKNWKRIILVTSAWHLKRSEAVFRKQGIALTAVGCDFIGLAALESPGAFRLMPTADGILMLSRYVHEKVGWWLYRSRGWLDP